MKDTGLAYPEFRTLVSFSFDASLSGAEELALMPVAVAPGIFIVTLRYCWLLFTGVSDLDDLIMRPVR